MSAYTTTPERKPNLKVVEDLENFFAAAPQWQAQLKAEREHLRRIEAENHELTVANTQLENERDRLRALLDQNLRRERTLKEQLTDQSRQLDRSREDLERLRSDTQEERRKQALQVELSQSQLDASRAREEQYRAQNTALQQQVAKLQEHAQQMREYLQRYQGAWSELQKQATQERRDKQAALGVIKTAEARIQTLHQELEALRNGAIRQAQADSALHLRF